MREFISGIVWSCVPPIMLTHILRHMVEMFPERCALPYYKSVHERGAIITPKYDLRLLSSPKECRY